MSSFRTILPLEREYRLRDALNVRSSGPGGPAIAHVASWKTASQWVRMVMSDPQLMRATGYRARYVRGTTGAPGLAGEHIQVNTLATPIYAAADHPLLQQDVRVFAVVREPVALARSWFRANATNHPSNEHVDARRRSLDDLRRADADGETLLRASFDFGFVEALSIGASWIGRADEPNVRISRFEDLTHPSQVQIELSSIFDHLEFGEHTGLVPRLVERYGKSRIGSVERWLRPASERKYGVTTASSASRVDELSDEDVRAVIRDTTKAASHQERTIDLLAAYDRLYPSPLSAPTEEQPTS